MGYIGGTDQADVGARVALPAAPHNLSLPDLSAEEAMSAPTLLVEGLIVGFVGFVTGIGYQILFLGNIGEPSIYAATGFMVALIYCGALRLSGSANPDRGSRSGERAGSAISIWVFTFAMLTATVFALKIGTTFSRGAVFSFFLIGLPIVVSSRVYVPRILARMLSASTYRGREAIITAPKDAQAVAHLSLELRAKGCDGVHTMEFDAQCAPGDWPQVRQRLLKRIIDTARVAGPGEIFVVSDGISQERVASIQAGLRLVPRAVYVVPTEAISHLFGRPTRRVGSTLAVETQRVPLSYLSRATKRAIDLAAASMLLALLLPVFAIIAVAIKLDSSGPVFFKQRRNGYRGREFRIVKFRTMTVLEDGGKVTQARRDDQRITRVGSWLRKTSFDELPQLFNVLRGEMSLVGPRPHAVAHDELYTKLIENYELRQHVKPGVTGWAQVNGLRGETPTIDLMWRRIEFDLWYASNCSVALDIQILFRTLFAVLKQENAY